MTSTYYGLTPGKGKRVKILSGQYEGETGTIIDSSPWRVYIKVELDGRDGDWRKFFRKELLRIGKNH